MLDKGHVKKEKIQKLHVKVSDVFSKFRWK